MKQKIDSIQEVHYIDQADEAAELLQPVRIEMLSRLAKPKSCPELARELGLTTQKVNYHMSVLKEAGLVKLVEERRKRGTIEGVYQAVAKSFWFSPRLVSYLGDRERSQDQASLSYLLGLAEDLQVDIGQMIETESDGRQPSLGVNAQIELKDGNARAEFLNDIKQIFEQLARKYSGDGSGQIYRMMLACYAPESENKH